MENNIRVDYIRQPAFYKDFQCIGDKCPVNCCYGWHIGWEKDEYEKLINAQMPDYLREKINNAFEAEAYEKYKNVFDYQVKFNENGKCPMLAENGLCSIQKELGAEYLSGTCMSYPRRGFISDNTLIRTCYGSCVHVVEIICNNEDSMKPEIILKNQFDRYELMSAYSKEDFKTRPYLKYERELFEFFYELLSDRTHSIETSLVLGGLAAQKLDEFIKKRQHDKIPEILKALKPQLNNPAQIQKLEKAKPNISLKCNVAAALLKALNKGNIYLNVFENGIPSEEKYREGMDKWNAAFGDKPFALRNIALNLYISQRMPFRDKTLTLFENFCYFAAQMSVIKFLAAAVSVQSERTEESFEVAVSYIDRSFTHNNANVKTVIEVLRTAGINSPAYLMGILK